MAETTILIVDDSPLDLRLLEALVEGQAGFRPVKAATAQEALAYVRQNPSLDLLLVDVNLPDLSGIEVCRQLKSDPATSRIPIVMISGVEKDDASIAQGLDAGADGYLRKPSKGNALRAWLKATLRISRLEQTLAQRGDVLPANERELLEAFGKMSHAVNNPLQSLMASADLLSLDLPEDEQHERLLASIQDAAERIAEMVAEASLRAKAQLKAME